MGDGSEVVLDELTILTRLLLAVLLGGVLGLEREIHGKAAGFRTNILICVGCTIMMIVSIWVARTYAHGGTAMGALNPGDPGRIAASIVTGIGFLGAGAILQTRGSVIGLTTAATIWSNAGIGLAIGSGFYAGAFITAFIVVIVLAGVGHLERWMQARESTIGYEISGIRDSGIAGRLMELMHSLQLEERSMSLESSGENRIRMRCTLSGLQKSHRLFCERASLLEGISALTWDP